LDELTRCSHLGVLFLHFPCLRSQRPAGALCYLTGVRLRAGRSWSLFWPRHTRELSNCISVLPLSIWVWIVISGPYPQLKTVFLQGLIFVWGRAYVTNVCLHCEISSFCNVFNQSRNWRFYLFVNGFVLWTGGRWEIAVQTRHYKYIRIILIVAPDVFRVSWSSPVWLRWHSFVGERDGAAPRAVSFIAVLIKEESFTETGKAVLESCWMNALVSTMPWHI